MKCFPSGVWQGNKSLANSRGENLLSFYLASGASDLLDITKMKKATLIRERLKITEREKYLPAKGSVMAKHIFFSPRRT